MNPQIMFWVTFIILLVMIIYLDKKYSMLRDMSIAVPPPFSFGRVQLAWWSLIVISSFVTITLSKGLPTPDESTIILLGISVGTTATARLIDVSDRAMPGAARHQDLQSDSFLPDILSDARGVSIHRFQAAIFNVVFGVWFIIEVFRNLGMADMDASEIMPTIEQGNLVLMGLSSATYAALKSTENKEPST